MTDQTTENAQPEAGIFARSSETDVKAKLDTILDLDTILSSARRTEGVQPICLDGDLTPAYDTAIAELRTLVDGEGNPINDDGSDASLDQETRAVELQRQASELLVRIREKTAHFRFRALSSDEWEEFDSSHRTGSDKRLRDVRKYEDELIAKCAISPVLDLNGVARLREQLSNAQITALFNKAYYVNNRDGIDVPKSPSFLVGPKPQEPSLS